MKATSFGRKQRARNGEAAASNVSFAAYANGMPATQAMAPYLGRTVEQERKSQADVVSRMVGNGSHMAAEEITRVLDFTGVHVMNRMAEEACAVNLGFVRIFPALTGTFDSADAPFDNSRNRLYVAAAPEDDIRDALSAGIPSRAGGEPNGRNPHIDKVTWGTMTDVNTIKSGEPFSIRGTALTVGKGGETAVLTWPGDGSVDVVLEPQAADDGNQRIVARLARTIPACTNAKLTLRTHGLLPASSTIKTVSLGNITVLAGDVPQPVGPTVTAVNDGTFHSGAGNVVTGTNMRFADEYPSTHVVVKNSEGEDMGAMISDDLEVPFSPTRFGLNIDEGNPLTDGEEYVFEFGMVDADGQPVTVTHAARWRAS